MSGLRRSRRQTLTGLHHLNYDAKYHPMDEAIRPSQAKKRKRAHLGEDTVDLTSDDDTDSINTPAPTARRQSRRPSSSYPACKEHPQDEQLKAAGALPSRRKKAIVVRSDTEVEDDSDDLRKDPGSTILTPATTSSTNKKEPAVGNVRNTTFNKHNTMKTLTNSQKLEQQAIAFTQAWKSLATPALTQMELKARDYQHMWLDTIQQYQQDPRKWALSEDDVVTDFEEDHGYAADNDGHGIHESGTALINELEAQDDDDPLASSKSTAATVRLSGYDSGPDPSAEGTADHLGHPTGRIQEDKAVSLLKADPTGSAEEQLNTESDSNSDGEEDEDETEEEDETEDKDHERDQQDKQAAEAHPRTPTRSSVVSTEEAPLSSRLQRLQASAGRVDIVDIAMDVPKKPTDTGRWLTRKSATATGHEEDARPTSAQSDLDDSFDEVFKTTVFHQKALSEEL